MATPISARYQGSTFTLTCDLSLPSPTSPMGSLSTILILFERAINGSTYSHRLRDIPEENILVEEYDSLAQEKGFTQRDLRMNGLFFQDKVDLLNSLSDRTITHILPSERTNNQEGLVIHALPPTLESERKVNNFFLKFYLYPSTLPFHPNGLVITQLFKKAHDGTWQKPVYIEEENINVEKYNSYDLSFGIQQQFTNMTEYSFEHKKSLLNLSANDRKILFSLNEHNQDCLIFQALP